MILDRCQYVRYFKYYAMRLSKMEINVKRIGIVGSTGYTGLELLRMLATHESCEIYCLMSRSEAGNSVAKTFCIIVNRFYKSNFL